MLLLLVVGCLFIILEMSVLHYLPFWELKIDGITPLVVYASLYLDQIGSILLIFSLSMLMDVFSGSVLGMHVLLYFLLFILIRLLSRNLIIKDSWQQIVIIFLSCILVNLCVLAFNLVFMSTRFSSIMLLLFFLQSLLTSALGPFFFRIYSYCKRVPHVKEMREPAG